MSERCENVDAFVSTRKNGQRSLLGQEVTQTTFFFIGERVSLDKGKKGDIRSLPISQSWRDGQRQWEMQKRWGKSKNGAIG